MSAELCVLRASRSGIGQRSIVRRKIEQVLLRQRGNIYAHHGGIALAASEILQLLVDRRRALAGQIWNDRIGADAVRAVAIVAGLRDRGARAGVALCEASSRLGRPGNRRSRLACHRREIPARCRSASRPRGKWRSRDRARRRLAEPRAARRSRQRPQAKNSPTVAPIQMANRESRGAGWSPLVIRAKPEKRARPFC